MDNPERNKKFSNLFDDSEVKRSKDKSAIELRHNKREELSNKRRNIEVPPEWVSLRDHYPETYTLEELPQILLCFQNPDDTNCLFIAQAIRKMLCKKECSPINEICSCEVMNHLTSWLGRFDNTQLQYETLWICTNIASTDKCIELVRINALGPIVNLLTSQNQEVRNLCAWVVGNIAADSAPERDMLLEFGCLQGLISCLNTPNKFKDTANILWAISNLCRKKPLPNYEVIKPGIAIMLQELKINKAYPLVDILWATNGYLSNNEVAQYLTHPTVVPLITSLLSFKDKEVKFLTTKIVGGLSAMSSIYTQIFLEAGVENHFNINLESKSEKLRKETIWSIANFCCETYQQLDYFFNVDIFRKIIKMAEEDIDKIRSECAWVLCNTSAVARPDQIVKLVELNIIKAMISLLEKDDNTTTNIILQGILKILECGQQYFSGSGGNLFVMNFQNFGGFNSVAKLQFNDNQNISSRAIKIINMIVPEDTGNAESSSLMEIVNNDLDF